MLFDFVEVTSSFNIQMAGQMVAFVLDDAGEKITSIKFDWFAVLVKCFDVDVGVAFDFAIDARHGQTTFFIVDGVARAFGPGWVDKHEIFARSERIKFFYNRTDLDVLADLNASKSHAIFDVHCFDHVFAQFLHVTAIDRLRIDVGARFVEHSGWFKYDIVDHTRNE